MILPSLPLTVLPQINVASYGTWSQVLDDSINTKSFDAFKKADVYSLALVYWELARRCTAVAPTVCAYQLPYFDRVSSDPNVEEMRTVVCDHQVRPDLINHWPDDEVRLNRQHCSFQIELLVSPTSPLQCMNVLSKIIRECWASRPECRLTALRIKKNLSNLCVKDGIRV